MAWCRLLMVALLGAAMGCATPVHPPERVTAALTQAVEAGRAHHAAGRPVEAAQLAEQALSVDQDFPGARELRISLAAEIEFLFDHPALGSNFAKRPSADRSLAAKVLLYLPDRLLDLTDILSFDAHLGLGAFANLHFTRAVQFGLGARGVGGIGWHDHRSLGVQGQAESGAVLPGVGAQAYSGSIAGTSGVFATSDATAGVHRPSNRVYQQLRDYWAVGAAVTVGAVGVDFDLHPVELADFFVGIAGFDLLHDDFAGTHGLALSREERSLLRTLAEMQASDATMQRYRESRGPAPSF